MTLKAWLKGLGVFVASSVITTLAATHLDPQNLNFSRQGIAKLGALVLIVALKAVLLYFKGSPLQVDRQGKLTFSSRELANLAVVCAVVPAMVLLSGCVSAWERQTYATLAASKAVIDCAVAGYNNFEADMRHYCVADPADPSFDAAKFRVPQTRAAQLAIEKARQTQVAAVEAFEAYAVAKVGRDKNVSLADKQAAVIAVVAQLPQLIEALRVLAGSAAEHARLEISQPIMEATSTSTTETRRRGEEPGRGMDFIRGEGHRDPGKRFDTKPFSIEQTLAALKPVSIRLEAANGGN